MKTKKTVSDLYDYLANNKRIVRATKYVDTNFVIRLTRRIFHKKLPSDFSDKEFVLYVGRPNYRERQFIKSCVDSGETFPVRKVQLKIFKDSTK